MRSCRLRLSRPVIRYAGAQRILFLVGRSNLGGHAKLEFNKFTIAETQRKFPAEYNIQHLTTNTTDTGLHRHDPALENTGE